MFSMSNLERIRWNNEDDKVLGKMSVSLWKEVTKRNLSNLELNFSRLIWKLISIYL